MSFQSLKMAWGAITANKGRSFLTMLGIIIGVMAIVVLISLVNGATSSVTDSVNSLGSNQLSITITENKNKPLTLNDIKSYKEEKSSIEQVAPYGQMSGTVKFAENSENATIYGTTSAYADITKLEVESGRFLQTADDDNRLAVAVINQFTAKELYGHTDVVGYDIIVNGRKFNVVGVLKEDESMMGAMNKNSVQIYIPFTLQSRMSGNPYVSSFYVSSSDPNDLSQTQKDINSLLSARFNNDENAFTVTNLSSLIDTISTVTGTMTLLLGGIAAISLLVGGIGIMNIMLVSVTERTKEIGIRKAVGASRGSISLQFLIEALLLSLMGCAVGLLCSFLLILLANAVAQGTITFAMSGGIVLAAVAFSVVIGVVFGLYPANKASKMQPIEALRRT